MANYTPITKFDREFLSKHQIFKEIEGELEENKIDDFLRSHGIFGGIVPFYAHPENGGQLLGLHFECEYRTTRKDADHWNTEFYRDDTTYTTEMELSNKALWKSFDIIEKWNWKKLSENKNQEAIILFSEFQDVYGKIKNELTDTARTTIERDIKDTVELLNNEQKTEDELKEYFRVLLRNTQNVGWVNNNIEKKLVPIAAQIYHIFDR